MSKLTSEKARAVITAVLASASVAANPMTWAVGDIAKQHAGVLVLEPTFFARTTFFPTGYLELDRTSGGGLAAGECSAVSGPAGMGKTSFLINLAVNLTRLGIAVGIISLEMSARDIVKLALGIMADVKRLSIRNNTLTPAESVRIQTEIANMQFKPLHVIDRTFFAVDPKSPGAPTMDSIRKVIEDGLKNLGIRVWLIDYLGKIGPLGTDDLIRMPMLTNGVLDLARRTGTHICCLMQSNKAAYSRIDTKTKKRSAGLEDTKGCIETVADFDLCMAVTRDDWNTSQPLDPAPMTALVLKARHGPGGRVPLVFYKSTGRILEPGGISSAAAPTPGTSASTTSTASSAENIAQASEFYRPMREEDSRAKFSGKLSATNQP